MATRRLVTIALFAALAAVLMMTISIPIMPTAPFLKFDPSDAVAMISAAVLGPGGAVVVVALKNALVFMIRGANPLGLLMNLAGSGTLIWTAGRIYQSRPTVWGLAAGGAAGALAAALVMIPANLVMVPVIHGIPRETVAAMLLPAYIPFNLLKGLLSTALAAPLYLALARFLTARRLQVRARRALS
ncbi:MAG TPA: ECF transporter S component [Bacillota bacterium]